jgi:hypothetical protein
MCVPDSSEVREFPLSAPFPIGRMASSRELDEPSSDRGPSGIAGGFDDYGRLAVHALSTIVAPNCELSRAAKQVILSESLGIAQLL